MRHNTLTLAVVVLLAAGASGVVTATMDAPAADTASADALPANYTVDVVNPATVSDEIVDYAIETAWANDEVRSYFDDGARVHFEVWASELDDEVVHVKVAPIAAPDETRVIADVDLDQKTVTSIDEPVTLNASNAIQLNTTDSTAVSINDTGYTQSRDETSTEENVTRHTADQATQRHLNESMIERGGDGTLSFEIEDEDVSLRDGSPEDIIRIDFSPENSSGGNE